MWNARNGEINAGNPDGLTDRQLALLVMDMIHRTLIHHALWFFQAEDQLGRKRALELLAEVAPESARNQLGRLGPLLGFSLVDGIPEPLLALPRERLLEMIAETGKSWLAGDGLWFQAVEKALTLEDAKRCNDSCWVHFSPLEAWSIRKFLGLPEQGGVSALMRALAFRLYSRVNRQTVRLDEEGVVILEMNECRVQSARIRKGMPRYPCKSAGIVEYRGFAENIDERFSVECLGCPPDEPSPTWFCAWRFILRK